MLIDDIIYHKQDVNYTGKEDAFTEMTKEDDYIRLAVMH